MIKDHDYLDPTAAGDMRAALLRQWYERNRESFWDRHGPHATRKGGSADNFMIGLAGEAMRIASLDHHRLRTESK